MRSLWAVCALLGCGDNTVSVPAVPLVSGDAALTLSDDRTELAFSRGERVLLTMRGDAFSVGTVDDLDSGASFDPYWLYKEDTAPPDGMAWREIPADGELTVVRSNASELAFAIDLDGASTTVTFEPAMSGAFSARLTGKGSDGEAAFLRVRADGDPAEGFYGLGEWADAAEHRGKLRPMQMEVDLSIESSNTENHVPVPLLIGTQGWGLFAKSDRPGVFDVARQNDRRIEVVFGTAETSEAGLEWFLFSAEQPIDILKPYFEVTGTPGLPAEWAYGPLLWRDENRDQAQVMDDIQQIRSRKLATSGIWFDRPYATGVETFDWSATKFPAPATMLQALHDAGLRYAIWQAPYTAPAGNDIDPAGANFDIATAMGFFPPTAGVLLNNWSEPIDLTNPDAYAWWQENLRTYTRPLEEGGWGVEGFKLDYAEDIVVGVLGQRLSQWKFADGSDELTMHYGYTMLYHRVHRETLGDAGGFLLTRTGRWGDQVQGMVVWPGDLDASFDHFGDPIETGGAVGGLPTALSFGIGLSASGFPFYASDTGGYKHSPATNECWLRWAQANSIGSIMQVGDSTGDQPWEFTPQNGRDQTSLDIYARYALLHLRLFPYAWTYAQNIATTGRPIVRPFGLVHPELGKHPSDQYMFGDFMLSAPVIAAGQTSRDVVFPAGEWIGWFDGAVYDGGTHNVPAPLDTLPLFLARGGIVPMLRETAETLSPVAQSSTTDSVANVPGVLVVRVAPGPKSSFTVFDGAKFDQEKTGSLSLGYTPGSRYASGALFEVIATLAAPATVINGTTVLTQRASLAELQAAGDGWFWESRTGGTLWIGVTGAATITAN